MKESPREKKSAGEDFAEAKGAEALRLSLRPSNLLVTELARPARDLGLRRSASHPRVTRYAALHVMGSLGSMLSCSALPTA